jgi:hypothetical protein
MLDSVPGVFVGPDPLLETFRRHWPPPTGFEHRKPSDARREAVTVSEEPRPLPGAGGVAALIATATRAAQHARAVVLVEGVSDLRAVEALARRRGLDLDREGIAVVQMGGAKNIRTFLKRFGPDGLGLDLAGLYDAPEEDDFRRGLEWAGLGADLSRADLDALGFFACVDDLEDELIRALGTDTVEAVVEAQGDLASFRTMQKQPAQRGRSTHAQLRRFMGSGSGRKIRYASLLVDALDLERVPRPLDQLVAALRT